MKGRADVPALLFADDAAHDKGEVMQESFPVAFRVVEAKRWNRVLDREEKGKNTEDGMGKFPCISAPKGSDRGS